MYTLTLLYTLINVKIFYFYLISNYYFINYLLDNMNIPVFSIYSQVQKDLHRLRSHVLSLSRIDIITCREQSLYLASSARNPFGWDVYTILCILLLLVTFAPIDGENKHLKCHQNLEGGVSLIGCILCSNRHNSFN